MEDIKAHDYVLTPGRFVGTEDELDDGVPFEKKFATLTEKLEERFAENNLLNDRILKNLGRI